MPSFQFILPHNMTEIDKLELVKIAEVDYDKRSAADFVELGLRSLIQFWRIEGDMSGLLLTQIMVNKRGRTLFVVGHTCKGVVKNPEGFLEALLLLAKSAKCKFFSALSTRPAIIKLAKKVNLPAVATIFLKEIEDAPG